MAIYHQDIADIELNSGSLHRSFLGHSIGMGDAAANRFGVRVFRDGVAETLSGVTCQGFFRNANGQNIALTSYGTISGNVAYVTLPQACYNVEGMFTLAIKLVGSGVTGTMRIIDGMVDNTNTGSAVAPTGSVPTYQEVLSVYEQMQAALSNYDAKVTEQDGKIDSLKSAVNDVKEWLGYPTNLFNGTFTTTHTSNWGIAQDGNDVTFTHLSQYTTGVPATATLDLAEGTYTFSANYNGETNALSLYNGTSYVRTLAENDSIIVQSGDAPILKFAVTPAQGNSVTISDIFIGYNSNDGVITQLSDDINQLFETTGGLSAEIDDLQEGFADISEPVIGKLTGEETVNQTINRSGSLITAGMDTYRVLKFQVTAGKTYWLTANANYRNLLWCFYDNNDNVIQLGTESASGATFTSVTDQEVTAPTGATYIRTTYNTTVKQGACKAQTGYTLAKKWVGKKWVCVGDSLTAENSRTTKHYFDYVAEETGITTVNMGDSGSGYAREQDVGTAFYQRIGDCPTDADVVTIFGSFNDLGAGLPVGSVDDTGTTTLAGCINTTIDNLQAVIPLVNLGIVAPTPWDTTQPSTSGNAYNYVEMLKAICERRSIPFLDLWRCSNLRPWDADFRALAYSKDGGSGTHPDENGHKLIAPRFKGFLETLLM